MVLKAKIGLLFHGPEVVDEGEAEHALDAVRKAGFEFEAALGGITGKTAIIDAGLQHVIDISRDKKPSEVALEFIESGIKFIILVNHAKSIDSALALGEGILRNLLKMTSSDFSFVQAEYCCSVHGGSGVRDGGRDGGGVFIIWRLRDAHKYERLKACFGFDEMEAPSVINRCERDADGFLRREICGVLPGEKILVNGTVIGNVSEDNKSGKITLVVKDGRIVDVEGGMLISHNLLKLPFVDIETAIVKTGQHIRRTKPRRVGVESIKLADDRKKACIFHTVEKLFPRISKGDVAIVITVGDDTTSIAGDILKRFEDIRLIGITDGDADGLIEGINTGSIEEYGNFLPRNSIVIRLKPERDDVIAEHIKSEIFKDGDEIPIDDVDDAFEKIKRRIFCVASDDIVGVISSESPGEADKMFEECPMKFEECTMNGEERDER
ncbi:hypothetical protein DRN79_00135 [Methanosarcinales archaeon]|nr:MAG: hypothetical protein DRN79_00135 [Methanosarcinales archaeon]